MNNTNRFLNRALILVVGVMLLAMGAGIVVVFVWSTAAQWWTTTSAYAHTWLDDAITRTTIGNTTANWVAFGSLAAVTLLIVLLIVALTRLGGGRTNAFIRTGGKDSPDGRIVIDTAFASDALLKSLDQRPEILFGRVSAASVRRKPMLHVSITPRQNTSPRQVTDDVERLLDNLAALTGQQMPTYVSIHSGLRARLAHDERGIA
ncbi:hypothetical protein [Salinibacterium sp. TMP30]|uniref:hypothetical protein n=1 Tax=Salinibacterium sp. TMP30 TaxID=3138237 RepID=UPI0031399860